MMFGDDEGPKDWEIEDEEPPESLRRKWDEEEIQEKKPVVCPSCKKETPVENLACIFCGTELDFKNKGEFLAGTFLKPKTPWYAKTMTLVISFLTVGPFALPLVWFNPVYSRRKKIIVTVIVLAVTYVLVAVFLHAVKTLLDYYKQAGIF
jgi:hypothetical protein